MSETSAKWLTFGAPFALALVSASIRVCMMQLGFASNYEREWVIVALANSALAGLAAAAGAFVLETTSVRKIIGCVFAMFSGALSHFFLIGIFLDLLKMLVLQHR